MKKATFLAIAAALFMGGTALAQTQEVTYQSDPSQGYLFNRFKDNWFITGEGGVGMYFSPKDSNRKTMDRWAPGAGLYVGKWFSPIIALRAGAHFLQIKDITDHATEYTTEYKNGRYKQKMSEIGPVFDAMVNLTNWWCGYRPGRVYNAILYAGAGGFFTYGKNQTENKWENAHDFVLTVRAGLINSFNVSKQVALSLDIRWNAMDNHPDQVGGGWNKTASDIQAYLGVTYNFKKREWEAPVVPVCPEPENCDALRARLAQAEDHIKDLENQLSQLKRNTTDEVNSVNEIVGIRETIANGPLATIYYPIGVYTLSKREVNVLGAVSNIMKETPNTQYVLTGWADNYTGTDQINKRLRVNRVKGVEKQLVKFGVPESQLIVTTDDGNLCDLGEKYVALDRAVTITTAK